MQEFDTPNVVYLEQSDISPSDYRLSSGGIINPVSGRPYFSGRSAVLIQGNYCGYCSQFKPVFQNVADDLSDRIDFATIRTDSPNPGEALFKGDALSQIIGMPLQGVPQVIKFQNGAPARLSNGQVDVFQGDRNESALKQWLAN